MPVKVIVRCPVVAKVTLRLQPDPSVSLKLLDFQTRLAQGNSPKAAPLVSLELPTRSTWVTPAQITSLGSGVLIVTVGARLLPVTVMLALAVAPWSSVAVAVMMRLPGASKALVMLSPVPSKPSTSEVQVTLGAALSGSTTLAV